MSAVLLPVTAFVLWRVFFALKWPVLAAAGDWRSRVLKNVRFATQCTVFLLWTAYSIKVFTIISKNARNYKALAGY